MTRNQKIALGCGGGGCLGVILLVVVFAVLIVTCVLPAPGLYDCGSRSNYNYNSNSNSNSNYNSNDNANTADNTNSTSDSSMSDDDRHRLFQAAAATQDHELTRRVWRRLGLLDANGSPSDDYQTFMKEHIGWVFRNASWVQTISDPEKARAYVDEHMPD